jgi:hypothetical protein
LLLSKALDIGIILSREYFMDPSENHPKILQKPSKHPSKTLPTSWERPSKIFQKPFKRPPTTLPRFCEQPSFRGLIKAS